MPSTGNKAWRRAAAGPLLNGSTDNHPSSATGPTHSIELLKTFQSHIDDMRNLIQCKICFRPLYEPYTLACGHTYCYSCLSEWFRNNADPLRRKSCPDCRASVKAQPSPNYLLREIIHMFVGRTELLSEGDTVLEHEEAKRKEAEVVEQDKAGPNNEAGLFRGAFKQRSEPHPRLQLLRDQEDSVDRCPECSWEWEGGGACYHCGYQIGEDDDFSDDDDDISDTTMGSDEIEVEIDYDDDFYGDGTSEEMDSEGGHYHSPVAEVPFPNDQNDRERYLDSDEEDGHTVTSVDDGHYTDHDHIDHDHAHYNEDGDISVTGPTNEYSDEHDDNDTTGSLQDLVNDDESVATADSISSFHRAAVDAADFESDYDAEEAEHEAEAERMAGRGRRRAEREPRTERRLFESVTRGRIQELGLDSESASETDDENDDDNDDGEPIRYGTARRSRPPNNNSTSNGNNHSSHSTYIPTRNRTRNNTATNNPNNHATTPLSNRRDRNSHRDQDRRRNRDRGRRPQRVIVDSSSEERETTTEPEHDESDASGSAGLQEISPPQTRAARELRAQEHRNRREKRRRRRSS